MNLTDNTILITGGASGIGLALARAFLALGNTVIVAGRRRATLDAAVAANPGMHAFVLDVEDKGDISAFARRVTRDHPALNVLVNNAGVMRAENLTDQQTDLADAEATVATNLLGPIRLIAALTPHLSSLPAATIVNVTSGLAFVPLARTPTYSATKAALHSYTLSLRHQLRATGIEVLELAPPAVQTDLMPGHAVDPTAMPLGDFIAETMALFADDPTPAELGVGRLAFLRRAEAEGRFDETFATLNGAA